MLTIGDLQVAATLRRKRQVFDVHDAWTLGDWGCALAGEVGELCNWIKKMRRGQLVPVEELGKELGDIMVYAALIVDELGLSLEKETRDKFNEVSQRWDLPDRL